jgi:ferric-dicitrate binding protein FerR (iron transport regulator)
VTGDAASRDVWLDGRAYFSVAKQDGRRFRVRTALGQAVVLGTRFDLRAQDGELHLVVVEGRVALSAGNDEVPVEAGQVSGVIAGRITPAVSIPDARAEVDWIGHFLVFDGTPLLSAASELARVYGVAIRIEAPALEARTITGWFSDQTYDEVVTAVCRVVKARCTVADSVVLIGQ